MPFQCLSDVSQMFLRHPIPQYKNLFGVSRWGHSFYLLLVLQLHLLCDGCGAGEGYDATVLSVKLCLDVLLQHVSCSCVISVSRDE